MILRFCVITPPCGIDVTAGIWLVVKKSMGSIDSGGFAA
jgi:hypothetical protein